MKRSIILALILARCIIPTTQAQAQACKLFCKAETITAHRVHPVEKVWTGGDRDEQVIEPAPTPAPIEPVILYACTYDAAGNVIVCIEVGSYIPGLPLDEL
jgi:hypothetical protein